MVRKKSTQGFENGRTKEHASRRSGARIERADLATRKCARLRALLLLRRFA